MAKTRLNEALELWARWCSQPDRSSGRSPLARWMDAQGEWIAGSGEPIFDLEENIEASVMQLATHNPLAAQALRLETGALPPENTLSIQGASTNMPKKSQASRAEMLGVTLRQYRYALSKARSAVQESLIE